MANKLFRDLSANTVQTGITQLSGLLIFYLLSRFIPKDQFGDFQWTTAVGSTLITIGSLGLDMVLVKRIAAGKEPVRIAGIHFFHTLVVSSAVLIGLVLTLYLFPEIQILHPLFLLIVLQQALTNIANSFKFSLTGFQSFRQLAIISILFNLGKMGIVCALFFARMLTIRYVAIGFLLASLIELTAGYLYLHGRLRGRLKPLYAPQTYKSFVRESLPQLGVVLFDSALARIDWILLGIFSTASITAEYTFAYKFFELSKLPLLILAPVLLTRLSALTAQSGPLSDTQKNQINRFVRLEMIVSFCIPVVLCCIWSPFIDRLTDGKFGAVNQLNFELLAICIPLHFAVNFLWTLAFVQGRLKAILYITILSSVLNLLLNIILIPRMGSLGAAISFLVSSFAQLVAYYIQTDQTDLKIDVRSLVFHYVIAVVAVKSSTWLFASVYIAAPVAFLMYMGVSLASGQFSLKQFTNLIKR